MSKYNELSKEIIEGAGGPDNIKVVNHCATRLRLTVSEIERVNQDELKQLKGVMGVVSRGNELQVIIGTDVANVYSSVLQVGEFSETQAKQAAAVDLVQDEENKKKKKNPFAMIVDFISGTFVPVLPVLVAAGLVAAVLNIAVTFFGLSDTSGTYTVLTAVNNAGFFFLPIFIGYSAARKLSINPLMGMYLGAILVHSSINDAEGLNFLGIAIPQVTYSTSVIPIILGVLFMSVVDKGWNKVIPKEIKFFAQPLLTILIVTPVTLIVLGPLGNFIGTYIASGLNFVNVELGWLSVGLIGALTPLLVMTGTNQALFPLVFAAMADNGYDAFVMSGMLAANVAIGAAALAMSFLKKDKDTKAMSLSAGITGVMGITEPAIFGVLIRFRAAFVGAIAGGLVGGIFAGIVFLKQYAVVSPGIAAIPTFIPTDGSGLSANFWYALVTIVLAAIVSFITTFLAGRSGKFKS
ncbi:PTS transporter subunit EIIC [Terribacillus saccharophilus]|uniref:PTS transporter subunit EIIC n=1 Tax=Terribacillus saccharophilus TaxID=361277 RepID=UPI003981DC5C